jgi:hypothetical protein
MIIDLIIHEFVIHIFHINCDTVRFIMKGLFKTTNSGLLSIERSNTTIYFEIAF